MGNKTGMKPESIVVAPPVMHAREQAVHPEANAKVAFAPAPPAKLQPARTRCKTVMNRASTAVVFVRWPAMAEFA
jgi:hypothetical protein